MSATPGPYELERSEQVVQQLIRPTGVVDPTIEVRPTDGQIDDLLEEIRLRVERGERALITTLTKKMAEDLADYLRELGIKVQYLHSEVDTLERVAILRDLRLGVFDVLVGINLLREGIDLPEVTLVAILDADKEGFLRSSWSLIQMIGRAARNIGGKVVMYADRVTESMAAAIEETDRRRSVQEAYNLERGIEPTTIVKGIHDINERLRAVAERTVVYTSERDELTGRALTLENTKAIEKLVARMEAEMKAAAKQLEFERAAALRDEIQQIRLRVLEQDQSLIVAQGGGARRAGLRPRQRRPRPPRPPEPTGPAFEVTSVTVLPGRRGARRHARRRARRSTRTRPPTGCPASATSTTTIRAGRPAGSTGRPGTGPSRRTSAGGRERERAAAGADRLARILTTPAMRSRPRSARLGAARGEWPPGSVVPDHGGCDAVQDSSIGGRRRGPVARHRGLRWRHRLPRTSLIRPAPSRRALDAAQSGGVAKLADFACAAKKDDIAGLFGGRRSWRAWRARLDADEVFEAIKLEFKDVQTTEKSRSGDSAVVHLTGTMTVTVDPAKMRDVMKKVMEAQGQPVDDATLDAAIAAMASQLSQTQALDEDVHGRPGGRQVADLRSESARPSRATARPESVESASSRDASSGRRRPGRSSSARSGPASRDRTAELVAAGMDVARLNFSHGSPASRAAAAVAVRASAAEAGQPVAILADLAGPKIRLGELAGGVVVLAAGPSVQLATRGRGKPGGVTARPSATAARRPTSGRAIASCSPTAPPSCGSRRSATTSVDTEVVRGGTIRSRAGVSIPSERLTTSALTAKDRADVPRALDLEADLVAQSFVRRAEDVETLRELLGPDGPLDRRQDRDARCGRRLRPHPRRRRRRDDRPRRHGRGAAVRGGADHPEAARSAGPRPGRAVDRRDPDARVDDRLAAPDAGRGERRRQRGLRRRGRDHAVGRDGDRRLPGPRRGGGRPICRLCEERGSEHLPAGAPPTSETDAGALAYAAVALANAADEHRGDRLLHADRLDGPDPRVLAAARPDLRVLAGSRPS